MNKSRLLVFGNTFMNFTMKVKRAPERGECVTSNLEHFYSVGGHGAISALTAAKYDTDVVFCSKIGEDENGDKLLKIFNHNNIDTRFLKRDKRIPTGLNAITIEDRNKSRIISYPGANSTLSYDDIESAFMCYPDAVLINSDLNTEFILDVINYAHELNVPIILSCSSEVRDFDIEDIGEVDIFSPNREAMYKMTGIDPIDVSSALHSCVKIIGKIKCKYIVIKLGERGCFVFDGVYSEIIPALDVEVIDDHMAGTIFTAALSNYYINSKDIVNSAKFANTVASLSVTKERDAYSSIPDIEQITEILKK